MTSPLRSRVQRRSAENWVNSFLRFGTENGSVRALSEGWLLGCVLRSCELRGIATKVISVVQFSFDCMLLNPVIRIRSSIRLRQRNWHAGAVRWHACMG